MSGAPRTILVWTAFDQVVQGHGGNLRSAQLDEICRDAGFATRRIRREGPLPLLGKLAAGLSTVAGLRRAGLPARWRNLFLLGYYRRIMDRELDRHTGPRILLWEETGVPFPAWLARRRGYTVVALPHNIESLVGTPAGVSALSREIRGLSLAHHVFSIAEEESWLLANAGLPADTLPYYPARAKVAALEAIAAKRRAGLPANAPWAILGTAHHTPTREGMRTLLRWVQPAVRAGLHVTVAGYGTEGLAPEFAGSGVQFLGAVSNEVLEDLLSGVRGILVHQDRGAGALTRIPEALIAGIPVVANRLAARGTRGYPGITVYDSAEELLGFLQGGGGLSLSPDPTPPPAEPLRPPLAAARRFTEVLEAAAAGPR